MRDRAPNLVELHLRTVSSVIAECHVPADRRVVFESGLPYSPLVAVYDMESSRRRQVPVRVIRALEHEQTSDRRPKNAGYCVGGNGRNNLRSSQIKTAELDDQSASRGFDLHRAQPMPKYCDSLGPVYLVGCGEDGQGDRTRSPRHRVCSHGRLVQISVSDERYNGKAPAARPGDVARLLIPVFPELPCGDLLDGQDAVNYGGSYPNDARRTLALSGN